MSCPENGFFIKEGAEPPAPPRNPIAYYAFAPIFLLKASIFRFVAM